MKFMRWIIDEGKSILSVTLYFAVCFGLIMLLKRLMLAQYGIDFHGLSTAVLGALVTAKVVIVVEKVPLSTWLGRSAAIVDVVVRSAVYTMATLLVLLLEKAIESRSEYGGVGPAIVRVFEHRDLHHLLATTLWVGLCFLAYNAFCVLRREIGARRLVEIFFSNNAAALAPQKET